MKPAFLATLTLSLFATTAFAQTAKVQINEIYISHAGIDDQEFIELKGTPNMKLDGYVLLVVEGDSTSAGTLDRVWDLTGQTIPADGYFVAGDNAVANVDFKLGTRDRIENGTDTFYLVRTTDVKRLTGLSGSNVEDKNGRKDTTVIRDSKTTIVDLVAVRDRNVDTDRVFDGALTIGPDGSFLPAGIYRTGDGAWCTQAFLDFDDQANKTQPRTPGAKNTATCVGFQATVVSNGSTCQLGVGNTKAPTLTSTKPVLGSKLTVTITGVQTGATALLFFGAPLSPAIKLQGCDILITPLASLPFAFSGRTSASLSFNIPAGTGFLRTTLAAQALVAGSKGNFLTNSVSGQAGF